jgi:hypothetical protein
LLSGLLRGDRTGDARLLGLRGALFFSNSGGFGFSGQSLSFRCFPACSLGRILLRLGLFHLLELRIQLVNGCALCFLRLRVLSS